METIFIRYKNYKKLNIIKILIKKLKSFFKCYELNSINDITILEILRKKVNDKTARKIINQLKKYNKRINLVLDKKLNKDIKFINAINNQNIDILDGKRLFKLVIPFMLNSLLKDGKKLEESIVSILVNNYNEINKEAILEIALKTKRVNIITKNINQFKYLEKRFYDKYSIALYVTGNTKKSLLSSDFIINFDYNNDEVNNCQINSKSYIIDIENTIENKDRLNYINDYKISINIEEDELIKKLENDFLLESIYESRLLKDNKFSKY